MKVQHQFISQSAIAHEGEVMKLHSELLGVLEDLAVPLYAGKSSKQPRLDLVHPVLNVMVEYWLEQLGWKAQGRLTTLTNQADDSLKSVDFMFELLDGRFVVIEVQFGNGARTDTDLNKLIRLHRQGKLALGYIVCLDRDTAKTADSGIAYYEKYVREALALESEVPLCIVGLSREETKAVDLSEVPGVPFPQAFGGSRDELHVAVTQAILDGRALSGLALSDHVKGLIEAHARKHLKKALAAFKEDLTRILVFQDCELRNELLEMVNCSELLEVLQSVRSQVAARTSRPPAAMTKEPASRSSAIAQVSEERLSGQGGCLSAVSAVVVQHCPPARIPGTLRARKSAPATPTAPSPYQVRPASPPGANVVRVPREQVHTPVTSFSGWAASSPSGRSNTALGAAFVRALQS